ncbi:Uma2 family endonuclease [Microbispora sp. H10830]|uniref:Uma2 family endonuclease n=1 Tax=Microbispora sp. H10830 TaxID=2729109 RepID=UPI001600C5DD|nr:Uma2 family endonuclease [Microbispora sp. H10830]
MTSVLDDWLQPRPGGGAGGVSDRLSRLRPAVGERRDGGVDADHSDDDHSDADHPDADHSDDDQPDAGLIPTGPQTRFHERMTYGLRTALNAQVPGDLVAVSRMDVLLGPDRRARPDVSLVDDLAASDDRRTCYLAEEVRLVIEVVGPDSAASDCDVRPRHYAAAGIPHFWRVEESADFRPFVYSFVLDADGAGYQVTGVHHTRLAVDAPFPIAIDLERLPR